MKEFEKWIKKAESDLYTVQLLLNDKNCQPDICCFHCQQAAEKYLKAYLVARNKNFPKTHDLDLLVKLLVTINPKFQELFEITDKLNDQAVAPRYPGSEHEPTIGDAQQAYENTLTIKDFVLKHFFN